MLHFARYALILTSIVVMAVYLPLVADSVFGQRVVKTHMFYSPVLKKFIWRDTLLKRPKNAKENMHHALFRQMDEDGNIYDRQQFEKLLPFIYFKNMALWGLLPLRLEGKSFDEDSIRANRQVIELPPRRIAGHEPGDQVHPLLESAPDIARLVFPEDRFRLSNEMEFINADYNKRDEALTETFTTALKKAEFVFPARLEAGKPTILKPFDEGVFLVDHAGALFHVKRVKGQPRVVKTSVDPQIGIRSLLISENSRHAFYGLLLTKSDTLYILTCDDYRLIKLPLDGYRPDTMDFKLIINPLYRTAIYSDDKIIKAVAMDSDYHPIARYTHIMPGAHGTMEQSVLSFFIPFRINLKDPNFTYVVLRLQNFGWHSLVAALAALLIYGVVAYRRRPTRKSLVQEAALVFFTGVYGLLAVFFLPFDE